LKVIPDKFNIKIYSNINALPEKNYNTTIICHILTMENNEKFLLE
jgi:hypothetical protein